MLFEQLIDTLNANCTNYHTIKESEYDSGTDLTPCCHFPADVHVNCRVQFEKLFFIFGSS